MTQLRKKKGEAATSLLLGLAQVAAADGTKTKGAAKKKKAAVPAAAAKKGKAKKGGAAAAAAGKEAKAKPKTKAKPGKTEEGAEDVVPERRMSNKKRDSEQKCDQCGVTETSRWR